MRTGSSLTTTSYAILSLLALRSWSTYELTRQMDRGVGRIWPRAASKLYEEPKKLAAHGLAVAQNEPVGKRSRTVYSITERGRAALAEWHRAPGAGPVLEFEQLLKLGFAEHGTTDDALATLAAARQWATERNADNLAAARAYQAGVGAFQQRLPQNILVGRFLSEHYRMVAEWADWATSVVEGWPDDEPATSVDPAEVEAVVRKADWV
jgi:DNA-binding PadR family transcriptional regulator